MEEREEENTNKKDGLLCHDATEELLLYMCVCVCVSVCVCVCVSVCVCV